MKLYIFSRKCVVNIVNIRKSVVVVKPANSWFQLNDANYFFGTDTLEMSSNISVKRLEKQFKCII